MSGMGNLSDDVFVVVQPWEQFEQFVSNEAVRVKITTVEPGRDFHFKGKSHRGRYSAVLGHDA